MVESEEIFAKEDAVGNKVKMVVPTADTLVTRLFVAS